MKVPHFEGKVQSTPCDELKSQLVLKISQLLDGVGCNPSGFGLFSEGRYLSFKDFEKYFFWAKKSHFEN